MAKIESWLHCDLKKAVQVQELKGNVFSLDNNGSRIRVKIFSDGEKATVSGTVTAKCILADDSTVNVNGSLATVDGQSVASVDIPQGCLLVPGTIRIAIKLTDNSVITTLAAVISTVYRTSTDNVITPSAQIIADWNQEISDALAAQDAQIEIQDGKIDDLESAMDVVDHIANDGIYNFRVSDFEQGEINSSGNNHSSSSRIRTRGYIYVSEGAVLSFTAGTKCTGLYYFIYDTSKSIVSANNNLTSGSSVTFTQERYIRFFVQNNVSLTPSEYDAAIQISTSLHNKIIADESFIGTADINISPLQKGYVKNDGSFGDSQTIGRTSNFISFPTYAKIKVASGYKIRINEYSSAMVSSFVRRLNTVFIAGNNIFDTSSEKKYIVEIKKADESSYNPADIPENTIQYVAKVNVDVVNAKEYGAVGDGVTDDSYTLQFAINAGMQKGIPVYIPTGTYSIKKPLVVYARGDINDGGSIIYGDGIGRTIIKKANRTAYVNSLGNSAISCISLESYDNNASQHAQHNFSISGMTLDCNNYGDFGVHSSLAIARFKIDTINIVNSKRIGIAFVGNTYLAEIRFVRIYNCLETGMLIYGGTNTSLNISDCYVLGCETAYRIGGMYCSFINCCGEAITGTVFNFIRYYGSIVGAGSEANNAEKMFRFYDCVVSLTGAFTFGNQSADSIHFYADSSKINCIGSTLMFTRSTNGGILCNLSDNTRLYLTGCNVYEYDGENVIDETSELIVS